MGGLSVRRMRQRAKPCPLGEEANGPRVARVSVKKKSA
jgi:hypothetical protein